MEAWNSLNEVLANMARSFWAWLPFGVAGLLVLILAWIGARAGGQAVHRLTQHRTDDQSLAKAVGILTRIGILVAGVLVTIAVMVPGVNLAGVIAFLGAGGIAAGLIFKDVLQNFMAGLLLLLRRPFRLGDQICSQDYEGTVEDINLRVTVLKTYAGERVLIPNHDVFTEPVLVRTAYGSRRSRFVVGISYEDDLPQAKQVIRATLADIKGVLSDPPPSVRTLELAPSAVNLEVFFWTNAYQADMLRISDAVATEIKLALDDAGIEMPYPVRRVLFEDHTIEAQAPKGLTEG